MKPKDLIFWLSFILLTLSTSLQAKSLGHFLIPLLILYATGWTFSWFTKDRNLSGIKPILTAGAILVLAGITYFLVNSFFLFQEIILIFLIGMLALIGFLSFNSYSYNTLKYIQILTFLLFISFPVFADYDPRKHLIIILLYILSWVAIIRLKFYLDIKQERIKPNYITYALFLLIVIISLAATGIIFAKIPPTKELSPKFSFIERLDKDVEDHYYAVQDNLLNQAEGLNFKEVSDKSKTLFFLSSLLKEFPATKEVLKSTLGLVTHIKTEGPGIEKGNIPEFLFSLQDYLKEKARRGMIKNREDIKKELAENSFSLGEKISTLMGVNKISHATKASEISKLNNKIENTINRSSANKYANEKLKESVEEFKNWKLIYLYTTDIQAMNENPKENETSKEFAEQLSLLLKQIGSLPGSGQLEEAYNTLEKVKKHKDAVTETGKELINNYENILNAYSTLTKDIDLNQYAGGETTSKSGILESIDILNKKIKLNPGEKKTITAIGNFADGSKENISQQGKWQVADEKIAKMEKGIITALSPGETTVKVEYLYKQSEAITVLVEEPQIKSIVLFPSDTKVKMGKNIDIEARAYFDDFNYQDVTNLAKWNLSNPKALKVEKGKIYGLFWGKSEITAKYQGIKSNSIQIIVKPSLLFILKNIGILLLLLLIIAVLILVSIRKSKEERLKKLLKDDPRSFIVALYDNIKEILNFFHLPYSNTPLFQYAQIVTTNTGGKNDLFFSFTDIFTKANYSSNKLTLSDGIKALTCYNNFLGVLAKKEKRFYAFIKMFLNCTPFFVGKNKLNVKN